MRNFYVCPAPRRRSAHVAKALFVALIVLAATVLGAGFALAAPGGNGGGGGGGGGGSTAASFIDFAQCKNGAAPTVNLGCLDWINGILQTNNSHYQEDQVVPERLEAELPAGGALTGRSFALTYQSRKGGIHAFDSLATWNLTQTAALRCLGLLPLDCVGGSPTTFAIPDDPTSVPPATIDGTATSGHMIPSGTGRVMTMYGGTITGVSVPVHDNAAGVGDDWATVTVTYSVPSLPAKVQLLFGGHLAATGGPRGWGAGLGSGNISGGPYHIKWVGADGESVGDRDNQIQGAAVIMPPAPPANQPPAVSCPAMSADGLTVTYTATASDPDGTIANYHWVFGDGQTADTATSSTTHTYAADGTYNVVVTVTDDDGATASSGTPCAVTVAAPPPPPVPNQPPVVSCPAMSADGLTVTYTAAATDADGTIANYHWVFGDGQTADTATSSTTHTYAAGGTYPVIVTVTDDDGATGSSTGVCAITVSAPVIPPPPPPPGQNVPPVVSCPAMSVNELAVTYTATATDADGTIANYHWVFGDGQTADTATNSTTHTYATGGTFGVGVTVTDDDGATASSGGDCDVTVAAAQTPPADDETPPAPTPPADPEEEAPTVVLPVRRDRPLPRTGLDARPIAWIATALILGGMLLRVKPRPVRAVFAGQGIAAQQVAQFGLMLESRARRIRYHAFRRT